MPLLLVASSLLATSSNALVPPCPPALFDEKACQGLQMSTSFANGHVSEVVGTPSTRSPYPVNLGEETACVEKSVDPFWVDCT